jgi:hypothetical protein
MVLDETSVAGEIKIANFDTILKVLASAVKGRGIALVVREAPLVETLREMATSPRARAAVVPLLSEIPQLIEIRGEIVFSRGQVGQRDPLRIRDIEGVKALGNGLVVIRARD